MRMITTQAQRGGKGEKGGKRHGRKMQSNSQQRKRFGHPLHHHPHRPHRPDHFHHCHQGKNVIRRKAERGGKK